MYILRIEFDDLSGRPLRLSIHPDEPRARQALRDYVRENWSTVFEADSDWTFGEFDDPDTAVDLYFNQAETESFSVDSAYLVEPDPFDTIAALHGVVKVFVQERIESIVAEAVIDESTVDPVDFDTLEYLDDDLRDRIGHVRFFLDQADRLVRRHGIGGGSP